MTDQEKLGQLEGDDDANSIIMDRLLRHAHYVQRIGGGEAALVLAFLRDFVIPEVRAILARELPRLMSGDFSGAQRVVEARRLEREIRAALGEGMADMIAAETGRMEVFAATEGALITEAIADAIPAEIRFAFEVGMPPADSLAAMVKSEPIVGQTIQKWWTQLGDKTAAEIVRQVNIGLASGEDLAAITARLLPALGYPTSGSSVTAKMMRDAESLARTVANAISAASGEAVWATNTDVLKGSQWVATLDNATCPLCWPYDGRVFAFGEGQRPPLHPSCRCVMVPYLKSWREIGIDIDDVSRGTRASMGGQVPETLSYPEWFARQPAAFQREVLGPGRYAIYKRGDLPLSRFTDVGIGRPLRIDELEALERSIQAGIAPKSIIFPGQIVM